MDTEGKGIKLGASTLARAAQIGLKIKDPSQFAMAADIDVVLFNKAGTLTASARRVVKSRLAYGSPLNNQGELLALAAGVEQHSDHPIAQSIVVEANRQNLELPTVLDVRTVPGQGVAGILDGETVFVGGPSLLTSKNIAIYVDDLVRSDAANQSGNTVVYVVQNSTLLGMVELSETVLPDAIEIVNQFHAKKIRVAMVTGDDTGVAKNVAEQLRIAEVFAEILPSRKADVVRQLKSDGSKVAVVGRLDLDALALSEAHVGIAIDSDGFTTSTAAGLHLSSSGTDVVLQTILLSKQMKLKSQRKRLGLFAAALVVVVAVVILLSAI